MCQYLKQVGRAVGTEHFVRCHAMRIDDLPLGSVDDRIRNETRPPARHRPNHQHCRGGPYIAFTRPDHSFVVQLVKSQARVGMDVAAVEPAQTVNRNRICLVFFQYVLHAQVHRRGRL